MDPLDLAISYLDHCWNTPQAVKIRKAMTAFCFLNITVNCRIVSYTFNPNIFYTINLVMSRGKNDIYWNLIFSMM